MDNRNYPTITLRKTVVFPGEKITIVIQGKEAVDAAGAAIREGTEVVFTFRKNGAISTIGVVAKIHQYWSLGPLIMGLLIEGIKRVQVTPPLLGKGTAMVQMKEFLALPTSDKEETEIEALSRMVLDQLKNLIRIEEIIPLSIAEDLQKDYLPPERTSDMASSVLKLEFQDKIELLELTDPKKRLEKLAALLAKEINIAAVEKKIIRGMDKEFGKARQEFILRERLKAIEKELGIFDEKKEYDELEHKLEAAGMPTRVKTSAMKELHRLRRMPPASAETPYIRTYLEMMAELPWDRRSRISVDLEKARKVLDNDHYGLDKAKERIIEYLAVQKLTGGRGRGGILCFLGPPGTGKTSVGQSIAKAVGRKFVRISLGGIRDEAEIRGHRRTYVGALPGRIMQGLRTVGTKNPVFMMDEIDKIGADFRGDPSAALLEVLDPEQNRNFSDHYIETPFDLSEVLFITTANILDPLPPALRDRLEIVEFPGYTDEEKFHIAKDHVLPKILALHGLTSHQFTIRDEALAAIINRYTREAGVRNLERKLAEIARKIAREIAEGKVRRKAAAITARDLPAYLGPEEFEISMRGAKDEVGVATGLAWTPTGGEVIFIEATLMPGNGTLTLTGQLGEIMQESAKAALSYIRSKSGALRFSPRFYRKNDVHVHVPSGAIPKDGPSAGIAIAAALASVITKRPIKKEVGLTGEITLTGKVLKVGGIKEKVLSAHRAGVSTIILPKDNQKNLIDIPREIQDKTKFVFIRHMDEALNFALIHKQ